MNTVKDFTFPSWKGGSWEDGTVVCCTVLFVYSERNPRKWLQNEKIKKDILKLTAYEVIYTESMKFYVTDRYTKICASR
jgi:hypothetical protein